ncbi:unnamed protein product [Parnassius apollo]|uniref:(apollo) hypothetical protein n=1 Tax=Parnassius apollo TaxID=110799 RepID=A0A8S3XCI4_PARAO|nr:unnamed protein product [Parnassius apollo]
MNTRGKGKRAERSTEAARDSTTVRQRQNIRAALIQTGRNDTAVYRSSHDAPWILPRRPRASRRTFSGALG